MGQYRVFSLADAIGRAQQDNMRELQYKSAVEQMQAERSLADLLSKSIVMQPGQEAVPEQVMPEGVLGPPRPAAEAKPASASLSWNKAFSQIPDMDPSLRGKAVLELQKMRMADELKRMEIAAKMNKEGNLTVTEKVMRGATGHSDPLDYAGVISMEKGSPATRDEVIARYKDAAKYAFSGNVINYSGPGGEDRTTVVPRGASVDAVKPTSQLVNEYATKIDKSGAARMLPAFKAMDSAFEKYPDSKKIPGIGGLSNLSPSTYFKSPEGKHFEAARQWIFNTDMKFISGGAVTDNEAIRNKISSAMTAAHTAEDYRRIYTDIIKPAYVSTMRGALGSHSKNIQDQYVRNGGIDLAKELDSLSIARNPSRQDGGWGIRRIP